MGYFPNATDQHFYEIEWCRRCVHSIGNDECPIMFLHWRYNYEQCKNDGDRKTDLELFIPRREGNNQQCKMFYEKLS